MSSVHLNFNQLWADFTVVAVFLYLMLKFLKETLAL